eukprot:scaffold26350_cov118-Isochrysis_galbana.AAC.1
MSQRGRLWLPAVEGAVKGNDRTLTLHRWVTHLKLRRRLGDRAGGKDLRIGELRIETNWAAMDNSRGSGKAIHVYIPKPFGTHAKAAHVKVVICGPRIPTKVRIMIVEIGDHEAVEVGKVVVDPQLPCLIVGGKVTRQPLHRVQEARRANLGIQRGVAHRSARR